MDAPSGTRSSRGRRRPRRGLRGLAILASFLALAGVPRAEAQEAPPCAAAPVVLVHPAVEPVYADAVAGIARGLRERTGSSVGVCTLEAIRGRAIPAPARGVVAVGERAYGAAAAAFDGPVVPILVKTLPPGAPRGLSLYLAPGLYLRQLRALAPKVRTVHLIHPADVPASVLTDARAEARAAGLRLQTLAADGLREAARAIDRVLRPAGPEEAVWFHRGLIGLNPDILVPAIVRLAWERRVPTLADEADYVDRGLLFALAHDYAALGRAAGGLLAADGAGGLAYPREATRILNRRTATALGLSVSSEEAAAFEYVYE